MAKVDTVSIDYVLPAEIVFPDLYHLRGSVAAAREPDDVNPDFESSGSQFYIVWGERMTPGKMKRSISYLRDKGIELDRFMIDEYQVIGGAPHLDGSYTVFGGVGGQTHGQHNRQRKPGSLGASSYPSRVFKGKRLPGRTGGDQVKVSNLKVFKVIPESNLILVKGSVPGAKGSYLVIEN